MANTLNLAEVFKSDAEEMQRAREEAIRIHSTDIRAAGNQVEQAVRDYLKRMLPPRYYVTSGHLIDSSSLVCSQLDVIIADNFGLQSLLTTKDGTEYVPITSVYAIGEVKSTYYKSEAYFQKFGQSLASIARMQRPLYENTAFGGEFKDDTTFVDIVRGSGNKFLNYLFSFVFCIHAGDFSFEDVAPHFNSTDPALLPNITVLLNEGALTRARINAAGEGKYHKYPTEAPSPEYDWMFAESMDSEDGSKGGSNLALLYGMLVDHLSNSHLEPADAYAYTAGLVNLRRSTLKWAKGAPPGASS